MKNFLIAGCIVDDDCDRYCHEDVTPTQIHSFLDGLKKGEEVTFEITSPGGSCTAGLAIASMIRKCSQEGHATTAHVIGLAASMASVIACSCDKLVMDSTAFMMVHNPWSTVQGNAEALRKEADTLDKFKKALVSIYRSKFDMDERGIEKLMDEETWILGEQSGIYGISCEVVPCAEPLRAAACLRHMPKYGKIPTNIKTLIEGMTMNQQEEIQQAEDNRPQETTITVEEADKRVQGMQSAMGKQIDSLKKEYESKLNDLQVQLQARETELTSEKEKVINLNASLESVSGELQKTASALEQKTKALETLNASVNKPSEELPTMKEGLAKCRTPAEKVAFLASGKYTK